MEILKFCEKGHINIISNGLDGSDYCIACDESRKYFECVTIKENLTTLEKYEEVAAILANKEAGNDF